MRPLRSRLEEARKHLGVPWEVLEKDYILSWVLAGISQTPVLGNTLVFKGGTALKKCYFGDYRFSEDLDFSGLEGVPTGSDMDQAMQDVCELVSKLLDEYAPIELSCERYIEKNPHPTQQDAFVIRVRYPWQRQMQTRIMVEITTDEKVYQPTTRKIIHGYDEPLDVGISVYSLEEIVAEKLRAILQHTNKLGERGWIRSRARDYYDLWRILGAYKDNMNFDNFVPVLEAKCALRDVSFSGADDFFQKSMMEYVESTWDQWLGPLVPDLPGFETVTNELRVQITALLPVKN